MPPTTQGPPQSTLRPGVGGTLGGYQLRLTLNPPNKVFLIRNDTRMPDIEAVCEVLGGNIPAGLTYEWEVTLVMNPAGVPHAVGRITLHPSIHRQTDTLRFPIPFTAVRGGTLTVRVTSNINNQRISAIQTAEVLGVNPAPAQFRAEGVPELLMKLMMAESSLHQFRTNGHKIGYPLFSADGLGGVGLGQITRPRPTDDEVWNWKINVKAALKLYDKKKHAARSYLNEYPHSKEFQNLVQTYNQLRMANSPPGPSGAIPAMLKVTLPAYTEEMLENETIRLYNGEPVHLHEYIAREVNGVLFVKVSADNLNGTAEWHQVTAAERIAYYQAHNLPVKRWGDPDYVNDVRRRVVL